MKTMFLLIGFLTIFCTSNTKELKQQEEGGDIQRIEIASLPITTMTRSTLAFDMVWTDKDSGTFRGTLLVSSILQNIGNAIAQMEEVSEEVVIDRIDTRIACLIYRRDGKIDSLSFSRTAINYNGRFFKMYTPLLLSVAEQLPDEQGIEVQKLVDILKRKHHKEHR